MNLKEALEEKDMDYKEIDGIIYVPYFYFDFKGDSIDVYLRLDWSEGRLFVYPIYFVNERILPRKNILYKTFRNLYSYSIPLEKIDEYLDYFYFESEREVRKFCNIYKRFITRKTLSKEERHKIAKQIKKDLTEKFKPTGFVKTLEQDRDIELIEGRELFLVNVRHYIDTKYWYRSEHDHWDERTLEKKIYKKISLEFGRFIDKQKWNPSIKESKMKTRGRYGDAEWDRPFISFIVLI